MAISTDIQRINVVGCSGSGKSTTARLIAARLGLQYIELDALYWGPGWTEPTDKVLLAGLEQALAPDAWVLDGNYARTEAVKWRDVQMIVWLDLPYWLIFWQVLRRTLKRSWHQEELWAGNRESLAKAFFSKDSILLWSVTNMAKVRRQYLAIMTDPAYSHISFVRLRDRAAISHWFDSLPR